MSLCTAFRQKWRVDVQSIIADETIFQHLAHGSIWPYKHLVYDHFYRGATLYLLTETLIFLFRDCSLKLPKSVFEPFRIFAPDVGTIAAALDLSTKRSIPFNRALIVTCAQKYKLSVGLTSHKHYAFLGLDRRFYTNW